MYTHTFTLPIAGLDHVARSSTVLVSWSWTPSFWQNHHIHFPALVAQRVMVMLICCFVAYSARIVIHIHTDRQNSYCNPACACAPRVKKSYICFMFSLVFTLSLLCVYNFIEWPLNTTNKVSTSKRPLWFTWCALPPSIICGVQKSLHKLCARKSKSLRKRLHEIAYWYKKALHT